MNLKPKCALVISTESIINLTQHPPTQDPTRPDSAKHSPEKHRKAVNMDLLRPKNWRTGTAYLLPLVDGFFRIGGLINGGFYRVTISNITAYGGFGGCSIYFLMNGRFLVDDTFFLYISYHPCSTTRFLYYHCKALKQYSAQLLIINCEGFTEGIQGYAAWKPTHPNISKLEEETSFENIPFSGTCCFFWG